MLLWSLVGQQFPLKEPDDGLMNYEATIQLMDKLIDGLIDCEGCVDSSSKAAFLRQQQAVEQKKHSSPQLFGISYSCYYSSPLS